MKIGIVQVALSHGGAELVGTMLANGLREHGNDTFILTDLNEPIVYHVDKNVQLFDFAGKKTNTICKWLKATRNIRRIILLEKPDVIIGIMGLCTLVTYFACLGLHIPIIMTEHNSFERPASAPMPLSVKFFKFWINKLYKHVTVLTEADKKVIGNSLKNVIIMPNPLLLKPIKKIPQKDSIILAAGRMDAWHVKGFDILLQAWGKIMKNEEHAIIKNCNWWLKIAGTGKKESFEYLMNLLPDGGWAFNDNVNDNDNHLNTKNTEEKAVDTDKLNLQKSGVWRSEKYHIEFLGFHNEMDKLYKKASIFVLSSRYEGFGLVLIEAMSQGCACVACDYKGRQKEIIGNPQKPSQNGEDYLKSGIEVYENGIICEPDNVNALAYAIKKMINDDKYRESVRMKAVEQSEYYSLEKTIKRWETLLNTIVK